uniref:Uncharacterized protein n=1 Tax=Arundo donax TaxID=35708 RepID=A0A0A8ZSN1_ARUDO
MRKMWFFSSARKPKILLSQWTSSSCLVNHLGSRVICKRATCCQLDVVSRSLESYSNYWLVRFQISLAVI